MHQSHRSQYVYYFWCNSFRFAAANDWNSLQRTVKLAPLTPLTAFNHEIQQIKVPYYIHIHVYNHTCVLMCAHTHAHTVSSTRTCSRVRKKLRIKKDNLGFNDHCPTKLQYLGFYWKLRNSFTVSELLSSFF